MARSLGEKLPLEIRERPGALPVTFHFRTKLTIEVRVPSAAAIVLPSSVE